MVHGCCVQSFLRPVHLWLDDCAVFDRTGGVAVERLRHLRRFVAAAITDRHRNIRLKILCQAEGRGLFYRKIRGGHVWNLLHCRQLASYDLGVDLLDKVLVVQFCDHLLQGRQV